MSVGASSPVASGLEDLGVTHVFGLPGTQNVRLFEELRRSSIRTILATSELAAAFMAVGYGRASGSPGVLVTIPGPGVTFALPGLAEARLDSVPVLHLVARTLPVPGHRFRHQEIPHEALVAPLVKEIVEIREPCDLPSRLAYAWGRCLDGEPGPVSVWISVRAMEEREGEPSAILLPGPSPSGRPEGNAERRGRLQEPSSILERIHGARRPVLFLGMGSLGASQALKALVDAVPMPFFTTASARGVIPEDHPCCLAFDFDRGGLDVLNDLLSTADLILALGCKLGHNGTGGFRLQLPRDRLVHVNTDAEALEANYPASEAVCASVEAVVNDLTAESLVPAWTSGEIAEWRTRIQQAPRSGPPEPDLRDGAEGTLADLFRAIRQVLPREGIVVTDSGLHQLSVRRHWEVLAPRGLIMPTDFQSMGFGLPAAVGASLAAPRRKVLAVIGDGGFLMSGMELVTLVREKLPVTVFVFNDGHLNLIRLQQERDFGRLHGVELRNPDLEAFAEAVGIAYLRLEGDLSGAVSAATGAREPLLVEIPLGDSAEIRADRRRARTKALVRETLGQDVVDRVKGVLARFRRR